MTESDLPKNPFFRVLSDRFLSDGFDVVDFADRPLNAGLSYGFAEETTPQGVSIKLVNTSASHGVVALWREHLDVRENYDWKTAQALPLLFQNDHWVRDHLKLQTKSRQLPQFVLPHVNEGTIAGFHGLRRFDQTTGGFRKDVWSGALLEFDKTDGYGSQRFAYEDRLVDRNGDGKAEVLRAVTHNERIVFTRAQIDAALQENGYVTLKGAEYTNAQGQITPLRFVLMQTIFTDRVDGRGHIKTVLVALDTEWGGDGFWDNIQTAGILTPAQIKEQSIIAAPNYGVYSAGALKDVLSL